MEPTLSSGSYVIAFKKIKYNIGDIVVVSVSKDLKLIKRISAISNQKIKLAADNASSSSSLCDPWYPMQYIVGKIVFNSSFIGRFFKIKEPSQIS